MMPILNGNPWSGGKPSFEMSISFLATAPAIRDERSEMESERKPRIRPTEKPRDEDEVGTARNRQELRQSLHRAQDDRLENVNRHIRLRACNRTATAFRSNLNPARVWLLP